MNVVRTYEQVAEDLAASIREDGTIVIRERAIPLPKSLSTEARTWFRAKFREFSDKSALSNHSPITVSDFVQSNNRYHDTINAQWLRAYPVHIELGREIGGVPTDVVSPLPGAPVARRALINIFAGMGIFGTNLCHEAIVLSNLMRANAYVPRYRTMPEHSPGESLEDVCTVYKELLKEYPAENIALFGSCSGGAMAMQVVVRMLQERIATPGAIASLTPAVDIDGDSTAVNMGLYPDAVQVLQLRDIESDLEGRLDPVPARPDPNDPVVSPIRASLHRFPPTLLIAGGRDMRCSGATILHRAMRRAGADADLVIFDAMFHYFHSIVDFPESKELFDLTARFFDRKLGGAARP